MECAGCLSWIIWSRSGMTTSCQGARQPAHRPGLLHPHDAAVAECVQRLRCRCLQSWDDVVLSVLILRLDVQSSTLQRSCSSRWSCQTDPISRGVAKQFDADQNGARASSGTYMYAYDSNQRVQGSCCCEWALRRFARKMMSKCVEQCADAHCARHCDLPLSHRSDRHTRH